MNSMKIELSDLQGKNIQVQHMEQQGSILRIFPSVIEAGFYLITVQENDQVSSFKIIKQ
ncbi:MAG: T9SS type A sorting domain-containing protein [Saprospiraceae bacterium]|nr:T9SS type A sorting domain-containing protein [Candidatus Defluviibacterium haderslevense]